MLRAVQRIVLAVAIGTAVAYVAPGSVATTSPSPSNSIIDILSDKSLWGKDALFLFSHLSSWSRSGDTSMHVYPQGAMGVTKYGSDGDARKAARGIAALLGGPQPAIDARVAAALRPIAGAASPAAGLNILPRFKEDDAIRIRWGAEDLQLLAPDLTIRQVTTRLGAPERIIRKAIMNETERRPVGLTIYSYAGGAIQFAESSLARNRGIVDRDILNLPAVTANLFVGAKP